MVKRYDPRLEDFDTCQPFAEMKELSNGDYVSFEDYEKCRKTLLKVIEGSKPLVQYLGSLLVMAKVTDESQPLLKTLSEIEKEF